jgi:hypothetical protein
MRLNVRAFALTSALVWSVGVLCLTWWIIAWEGSTHDVTLLGRIYRGYNISPAGSVIGFVWAFLDGLVGGAIFAWLYNLLTGEPPQKTESKS